MCVVDGCAFPKEHVLTVRILEPSEPLVAILDSSRSTALLVLLYEVYRSEGLVEFVHNYSVLG